MYFPDIHKMDGRVKRLQEALWHRQLKLTGISSTLLYLEFAREHRLKGPRLAAALYLEKANERYREAVKQYNIQKELEG